MTREFDAGAAALPGSGVFGLPHSFEEAGIVIVPVPFDATTSYRGGAADGPAAVLAASRQVDLHDAQFGNVYEAGIHMLGAPRAVMERSRAARALAQPIIERGGAAATDREAVAEIDAAGEYVNGYTFEQASRVLRAGKTPGVLGGDHSTPWGAVRACADHVGTLGAAGLGVLHLDAHCDFRERYEGFRWSHASIMRNVLELIPGVTTMVQVGLRDFSEDERAYARARGGRVHSHLDMEWARRMAGGERFMDLCAAAIAPLPLHVYISFDIDALDPSLCPHTGTPVPGGLSFSQACLLLEVLRDSGRRVVGFDLVEVAPGSAGEPEWDANVGARVLYKLCGVSGAARQGSPA